MRTQSIFEALTSPQLLGNRRLHTFFDFSLGRAPEDYFHSLIIHEIINQTASFVDGLIMLPRNLPDYELLKDKELWIRSDWTSAFNPTGPGKDEVIIPLLNPRYWDQAGISGIVGSLLLGNSAFFEADNIQYLAAQRSYCYEIDVPMAIDLHVLDQDVDSMIFNEIMELGLTLAVELGCDLVITPGGDYLSTNKNISLISELPILVRLPLSEAIREDWSARSWENFLRKANGIVFTETFFWNEIISNQEVLAVVQV